MQPSQQIAQVRVEGGIALIAAEPAGVPEVAQRAAAPRAAQRIARRWHERAGTASLDHRAQEVAQRALQHRAAGLDALLLGTLLAQVERDLGVMLDLGEVDDGVALFAVIA